MPLYLVHGQVLEDVLARVDAEQELKNTRPQEWAYGVDALNQGEEAVMSLGRSYQGAHWQAVLR